MKLHPIAMVTPTKDFVYAPSKIRSSVEVSDEKFIEDIAGTAKAVPVSFEDDGKSNPQNTTTYTASVVVKLESGKTQSWIGRFIATK